MITPRWRPGRANGDQLVFAIVCTRGKETHLERLYVSPDGEVRECFTGYSGGPWSEVAHYGVTWSEDYPLWQARYADFVDRMRAAGWTVKVTRGDLDTGTSWLPLPSAAEALGASLEQIQAAMDGWKPDLYPIFDGDLVNRTGLWLLRKRLEELQ